MHRQTQPCWVCESRVLGFALTPYVTRFIGLVGHGHLIAG